MNEKIKILAGLGLSLISQGSHGMNAGKEKIQPNIILISHSQRINHSV